ncbi:MAG TPA: sulfatase [Polyangiaceae bacterium]
MLEPSLKIIRNALGSARAQRALCWGVLAGVLGGCDKPGAAPAPSATTTAAAAAATSAPAVASAPPRPPKPTRPSEPLNVLFLTVDSLRADMPWAGYAREIAPNLTSLSKQSVVYENHRSVSSYTAQTVAAWLSGRYASTLYRTGYFFTGYSEANDFFTETLQKQGVATLAVHGHMYFARGKGLEQGFDIFDVVKGITFDAQTDNHVTSDKITARLIELLSDKQYTDKQFFAWAHYMDPHDQYLKHAESPDFGNKNRDRYDSEVWFTDFWIGKLLEFAKSQPWWNRTAVVLTSDHGEAFGEHSMYKHAFEVWEMLVKVPLFVFAPGAEPRRIDKPRTHIDIAPTLMDLMGKDPLPGFLGKSLVPEIYGAEALDREPLVLELAEDSHNPHRRAIISGGYKYTVYDTGWRKLLFNLEQDPGEEHDLSQKEPEKLAQMQALFEATFGKIPSVTPYGGATLKSGKSANGPSGPPKTAAPKTAPP